ncbi:MAG: hypothetical protein L0Z53_21510 [Acidobacteriales bacterium]|nr:hypothetical protein [Terriglobales bacterium]
MSKSLLRVVILSVLVFVFFTSAFFSGWFVGYRQGVYDGWNMIIPDVDEYDPPAIAAP